MDVVEADQVSEAAVFEHWYYRAKFRLLQRNLRQVPGLTRESWLADVGCGRGMFMTLLERAGRFAPERMLGIDPAYAAAARAMGGTAEILPAWPDERSFDIALMMDVLEHTPDDHAVLGETAAHVRPGGHVFITVPAFPWLWSAHDRFLGHYRRYTVRTLTELVARTSGLRLLNAHYYYASVFHVAAPLRLARRGHQASHCSDLKPVPRWLNELLTFAGAMELHVAHLNRIAGLSVVALCEKV